MKLLDIDLIASREFKKLDKEMTNNLLTHIHMLRRANLLSDNHRDHQIEDEAIHEHLCIYLGN